MSKARNFAINQWSITKLKLDLQVMVTDLYDKNHVNMYKRLEKSPENCLIAEIY